MYEFTAREMHDVFGAHLDGALTPLLCVVSEKTLTDRARAALASSAKSLGYADAATFITLEGPDAALDATSLFMLLEGLDPACIVAADAASTTALSAAYRCPVPQQGACRVLGRDAVTFPSFDAMLDDPDSKQRAWALLKKLPRRD